MVGDRQNVDPVCFLLTGWEFHFTGFDPPSFWVWPLHSGAHYSWAHAGFPPMSRVLPLYQLLPSFHKWWALLNWSGWVWVAMGSTDFTKLLFLLSIAQRLEWRGQTQKDGGSNPVKWNSQPMSRKQTGSTFCRSSTILLVANCSGPTIVRTKRANSERRLDQPVNFWGPLFMGPCWLSSNVQSAPSIPIAS